MVNLNKSVSNFLDELNHPFRIEIEELRKIILTANSNLAENIKWNGPNYYFDNEDRITMRIQPPKKQVQLIFHRGAKKIDQPEGRLIADEYGLLVWKENDRAIATFKSFQEIKSSEQALVKIINDWVLAI
ncbi:protein of unknown function (DU1801) [Spirosomataceae bacterium TFI 002]|nr:protein of unknown function (DU1801) [Spirosomataceae bacterium TFI 002]